MPEDEKFNLSDMKTLRRLVSILNGGELTQKEFMSAFEQVVQIVLNIEKKIVADNMGERKSMAEMFDSMKTECESDFKKFKTDANKMMQSAISILKDDAERRLSNMEDIVSQLRDGKDADEEAMLAQLRAEIPTIEQIVQYLPTAGTSVRDALELLKGKDRLHISAIDGVEQLQKDIADAIKSGKPIQIRGGATRGFFVYIGGVKKGIMNMLNFAAGTGMSIAYSKVNGLDTITFNSSGGGSTVETPPESPDASTTQFTVSAQPKWVVGDGTTYYEGAGYSYNSGTGKITMDVPPSSFIRAII